jgi:aminopeptidase
MTDIRKKLEKWSLAGKGEWEKTFKQIKEMKIELRYADGARMINPATQEYFTALKNVIVLALEFEGFFRSGLEQNKFTLKKMQSMQQKYYDEIELLSNSGYFTSFANPHKTADYFGRELGDALCLIYARFREYPAYLLQQRYTDLARLNRLFLDMYREALKCDTVLSNAKKWKQLILSYLEENMEQHQLFNLYWRYSPQQDYYKDIMLNADLSDLTYLFRYGSYISEHVMEMASFMQKYSEKELQKLSRYIVKSYEDGFERGNRSYKIKQYAILIIPAGMERLGRLVVKDLKKIGLEALVQKPLTQSYNKQLDYDHRFSMSLYYDQAFVDRFLPLYEKAVNDLSGVLKLHAGPVYVELFGEEPFQPSLNPAAFKLSQEQMKLRQLMAGKSTQIFYKHYKREEASFCIIAFPSPEIGADFKKIFADTVKLNMLDSLHYAKIQQYIIDVLDTAEYVHVKGRGSNQTDIMVHMHPLKNPKQETNFENCVADVNIPVGEVFTSPLLKGTNGVLHVKDIYLGSLRYKNIMLRFKDGMITDYSCTNFKDAEKNRRFVEENLLMPHKTLPIGEFAIGTNTTAYKIAHDYGIQGLLPILIIEKMGPHFAVGDTCYSREEDIDHFNFYDGKKIIAVENEISRLRKKDPMKAYTQAHTDITLPYDMLKSITAIRKDGSKAYIIKDGLFAVSGTEELNKPLLALKKQAK